MDRNTLIGFSLLAALLIGYIVYNNQSQQKYQEQKRHQEIADSVAKAKKSPVAQPIAATVDTTAALMTDSMRKSLPPAFTGAEQTVQLENKKLALSFTTKGAFPVSARIKNYKTHDNDSLYLFNGRANELSVVLPENNNISTAELFFTPTVQKLPNGDQTIDFTTDLGNGKKATISYTLPADDYMLTCNIRLSGMKARSLPVTWKTQALHTERDITSERTNSQIYYRFKNKDHDYFTIKEDEKKSWSDEMQWVGFRLHYFSTAIIAEDGFTRTDVAATTKLPTNTNVVAENKTIFEVPVKEGAEASINLRWYIGPNHYKTLRQYDMGLDEMVPLGYGIFSFVKYINKWIIIPIFDLLSGFITNYGIIIMLLTIFIRLILSFFTYKSYLSAAKMRVLKPEIDELRAKYADDQQKFGMEQMKLYRTAGVNPLGGCLPTLFQLPILFAMYYFFPSSIELRQKSFLWAHDLSTYDSIVSWTANVPVLSSFYGNHISLFTILMTASSLFLALYNRNMTAQDPNNPMMKYLPFVFPFVLMGVFNKMAAALTFYYFFSNMLSIAQQYVIQKFIINEDKIHAQIQQNKNKPATPSKWAARIEQMQKAQADRTKQTPRSNKK